LAPGGAKKRASAPARESRAEAAAVKFEKAAKWVFYISLFLGSVVFVPDYFYDFFEVPKLFCVQVGAALICCLFLFAAAQRGKLHLRLPLIFLPLAFLALMAVFSVGWSVNRGLALERFFHVGSLALFCFFSLRLFRGRSIEIPLYFVVVIAALLCAFGLALDIIKIDMIWLASLRDFLLSHIKLPQEVQREPYLRDLFFAYTEPRPSGTKVVDFYRELISTQGNPNFLFHILVLSTPAALGLLVHRFVSGVQQSARRWKRWLVPAGLVISPGLMLICFFRSQNRSSLVAVVLAVLIFLVLAAIFFRGRLLTLFRPLAARLLAGLAVIILAGALGIFFTDTGRFLAQKAADSAELRLAHWKTRFANLAKPETRDVYNRLILYQACAGMIADNPLLGKGIGQFPVYFPGYKTHEQWQLLQLTQHVTRRWAEIPSYAHNEYLQVFAELGVFAFISFLLFWILLGWQAIGSLRRSRGDPRFFLLLGTVSGIAGVLFNSLFTFPLQTVTSGIFFWTLAGLLLVQCEQFLPGGRLREIECQLTLRGSRGRLALTVVAAALLVLSIWGSFRLIRSQHLFFDSLKNNKYNLQYSIRRNRRAAELAPHHFELHYVQGWYHSMARDTSAARKSFEKAVGLAPYFPGPYKNLSTLYMLNGDYRRAEQMQVRYREIYPPGVTPEMDYVYGQICLKDTLVDRISQADTLLRKSGSVEALMSLARGYRERGKAVTAMELMPQVKLKLAPKTRLEQFLSAIAFFGHTALEAGDTATAREQFEAIIRTLEDSRADNYAEVKRLSEQLLRELDEK